jgi:hypothetical protein
MVSNVKLPQTTLPILLSFPYFHAFRGGEPWDDVGLQFIQYGGTTCK